MNITISPITFKEQKHISKPKENTLKSDENFSFASFKASMALKNQILFSGSAKLTRSLIKGAIDRNEIPLTPQGLEQALFPSYNMIQTRQYQKYERAGNRFFELYTKYYLAKTHPLKSGEEVSGAIIKSVTKSNKARVLNEILPPEILPKLEDEDSTQDRQAKCLNALLGAIIYENKDGYKAALKFMNKKIGGNIFPEDLELKDNRYEVLLKCIEEQGKSCDDFHCETKRRNKLWDSKIYYKNMVIAQAQEATHANYTREVCVDEVIRKLRSGEIDFDGATNDCEYTSCKKPDERRIERLQRFCSKWKLSFKDINLLHRAFLCGTVHNSDLILDSDKHELLTYLGGTVLDFCVQEVVQNHSKYSTREVINITRQDFIKNETLAKLAKKMKLDDYILNSGEVNGEKKLADTFKALIGAIFLDGGEDGLDNVYKFLERRLLVDILYC